MSITQYGKSLKTERGRTTNMINRESMDLDEFLTLEAVGAY